MWSVSDDDAAGVDFGRSEPAALVTNSISQPSSLKVRTAEVITPAVAFVEVAAALHADDRHAGQGAQHQFARVAVHGADREARQFVVADRDRVQHLLGQHAEAGTEDHRHARREAWLCGRE
jgi:hypothetical protein